MKSRYLIFALAFYFLFIGCTHLFKRKPPELSEEEKAILAENYVSDGIDFYQAKQYPQAIQKWKKALQYIPDDAEVYNFVGLAYHRSGKLDSAIYYFSRAVEKDTAYYQAWNNLGYMYFLQGKYPQALKYFNKALEVNPNYHQAKLNRDKTRDILNGRLKISAWEIFEDAAHKDSLELQIQLYKKALAIDSNYVDAWNNLGVAYFYYGETDSALYCLRKALQKNPQHPQAHNNLGYILDTLGQYDKAISHFKAALKINPGSVAPWLNLIDAYVHQKNYQAARLYLMAVRKEIPDHPLVKERIKEYGKLLNLDEK